MNGHNKIYIAPFDYNDVINFDRVWRRYFNNGNYYSYKHQIPKDVEFVFMLKFNKHTNDLEYFTRIK